MPSFQGRPTNAIQQKRQKTLVLLCLLLLIAYHGYSNSNRSIRDVSSLQIPPSQKSTSHFEEGSPHDIDGRNEVSDSDVELFLERGFDAVVTIATGAYSAMRLVSGTPYYTPPKGSFFLSSEICLVHPSLFFFFSHSV